MDTEGVRTEHGTDPLSEEPSSSETADANVAFIQSQSSCASETVRTSQNLMDDSISEKGETTYKPQAQTMIPSDGASFNTQSKESEDSPAPSKSQIFPPSDVGGGSKDSLSDTISKFLAAEAGIQAQLYIPVQSGQSSHATTSTQEEETQERTKTRKEEKHKEDEVGGDVVMVTETEKAEVRLEAPPNEESMETEHQLSRGFNFSNQPVLIGQASSEYQEKEGVFLKGCKWSPDGLCIMTSSEDNILRLFNLPPEAYGPLNSRESEEEVNQGQQKELEVIGGQGKELEVIGCQRKEMESVLRIREGELIYDYCWYPKMNSYLPETCCLASASRDHPVHLWDAFTGKLRGTYRSLNAVDELVTPNSLCFSNNGKRLFCGYNKTIRIFYTDRPGKECETIPTKKKSASGQTGIISCFAMAPELKLYAAGSYSKSVGLYTADNNNLMCLLQGQTGGVTHLLFSPDRNRLYSGGRKDNEILCWDLRNPGRVLYSALREVTTNQRVYFDLDREGRYLVSGNHNGTVTVWDTSSPPTAPLDSNSDPLLLPSYKYKAHSDCVNGVSLHPDLAVMATASGQRRLRRPKMGSAGSSDEMDSEDDQEVDVGAPDHSLRLWSLRPGQGVR